MYARLVDAECRFLCTNGENRVFGNQNFDLVSCTDLMLFDVVVNE